MSEIWKCLRKKDIGKIDKKIIRFRWDLFQCDKNEIFWWINLSIYLVPGKSPGKFTWFSHFSSRQSFLSTCQRSSACFQWSIATNSQNHQDIDHHHSDVISLERKEWETSRCNNISPHLSDDTTQIDLISNARFQTFQSLTHSLSRPKWKSKVPLKQFKYVFLTTFLFGCLLFHDVALVENEKGLQTPCVGGCEVVEWTDFIITTKTE